MRIGIDFGGVIVKLNKDGSIDPNDGNSIAQEGVFTAVHQLVNNTNGNVWIVSKADPALQSNVLKWLNVTNFAEKTGFDSKNLVFCKERQDKVSICAKLGITHFIDDHEEVLKYMIDRIPNLFVFSKASRDPNIQTLNRWTNYQTLLDKR